MGRTLTAFLIAPLWVPIGLAAITPYAFPHPEQRVWVYITITLAALFGYGGTLVFGVPIFLTLRAHGHVSFWIAPVVGFCAGTFVFALFGICFGLSLGENLSLVVNLTFGTVRQLMNFLPGGALGALVASTLWLIARPDRKRVA